MGAIMKEIGCQVDTSEWPVTEQLPIVAECLHSLPIGWTYLCVSEGVCFAHVKIGSTRKNVVCDKAVYLSVIDDNPNNSSSSSSPQKQSNSSSSKYVMELQLEIELRDMISFEGRIFRRRVAKCIDIIDLLKEIASGSDTVGCDSDVISSRDAASSSLPTALVVAASDQQLQQQNQGGHVPLVVDTDDVKYQDQQQLKELQAQEQQIKLQEQQLQKLQEQQMLVSPTDPQLQREQALLALERESQARRLAQHLQPPQADAATLVALRKQQQPSQQQQHPLSLPQSQQQPQSQALQQQQQQPPPQKLSPEDRELLYDTEPQTQPQNLSVNHNAVGGERVGPFKIKKEPGIQFSLSNDPMQQEQRGDANDRLLALAGANSSLALVPVSSASNPARLETPSDAGSLESREVQETLRMKHESSSSSLSRDARELQHQLQQQQLQRAAAAAAAAAAGQSSTHSAFSPGSFGVPSSSALQSIPGFASWMQQQQQQLGAGAGLISPLASGAGDLRRELMGGALHFDHDDAFPDSMDLDRSGGPSSSALVGIGAVEGERPHKCRICGRGFKTKAHHKEHMRLHSSICEFKCPLCFREFKQKSCFTHHLSRVHKNEGPFPCAICGLVFERIHDLARHIPAFHKGDPKICGYMDDAPVKKEPMPSGIRPPNDFEASLGRLGGRTLSGDDDLSHGGDGGSLGALSAQMAAAAASNSNAVSQLVNNSFSGMSGSRSPLSAAGYHDEGSLLALAAAAAAGSHVGTPGNPGGSNEPKFYEWDSMRMTQKMLQHSPSEMNHAGGGGGIDHDASLGSDDPGGSSAAAEAAAQAAHRQSLRTLEKLLLSPHGASVAAAMGGDVAAAAAALAGSAGAALDSSALGSIADVQHAMAILQQQQQQQQQSSTANSNAGILPSMATFVGNSASSLQRRSPISPSYSSPGSSSIPTATTSAPIASTSSSTAHEVFVDRATAAAVAAAAEVQRTSVIQNAGNAEAATSTAAALGLNPQLAQQLTLKQISALEKEYLMAAEQEKLLTQGRNFAGARADDKNELISSGSSGGGVNPFEGVNIAETLAAAEAAAQIAAAAGGANTPEGKSALSRLFNFTQNMSLPPNSGMDIFSGLRAIAASMPSEAAAAALSSIASGGLLSPTSSAGMAPPTSEALLAQQLTAFRAALQAEESAPSLDQSPDTDVASAEATASAAAAAAAAIALQTGPGTVYNPGTSYRGMPYDLECKDCVTTFKSSADFEAHFRDTHGNDRPYKCKLCTNSFKRKHHLVEHARLHSGKRGFKCSICGKEFKQRCTLTHHTRTHSIYSCPVCHKKFNGDLFLMKHMTIYNHLPPEMRLGESGANDMHIQPGLEIPATAQEVIIGQEIEIDANGTHSLRDADSIHNLSNSAISPSHHSMMPQFPGMNAHDVIPGVTGIHQITPDPDHHHHHHHHQQQRGSTTPLSSSTPVLSGNNNNNCVTLSSSSAVSPDIPMQHGAGGLSNDADAHLLQHLHHNAQQQQQLQHHSLNHPASPLNSSSSSSHHPHDPVHSLAHHHHHHALSDVGIVASASEVAAHITANVTTEAVPAEVTPSEVMSSVRGVDSLRNNGNLIISNIDDDDDDERRAAAVAALLAQRSPFGPPRALPLMSTTAPTASSFTPPASLHHNHQMASAGVPTTSSSSPHEDAVVLQHNAIQVTAESLVNSHHSLRPSQTHNPASSSSSVSASFLPSRSDHSPITPTEGSQTPFITPEGGNVALNRVAHESDHAMIIDSMNFGNAIRVHKETDHGDQGAPHLTEAEDVDHHSMDTD